MKFQYLTTLCAKKIWDAMLMYYVLDTLFVLFRHDVLLMSFVHL